MTTVLVTGMSGTGKSTVLAELARRGHRVVDADENGWSEEVPLPDGAGIEQLWREESMARLLAEPGDRTLFVAGCARNQVNFYDRFDAVVLLSAPREVLLSRIDARKDNPFGKDAAERDRILADLSEVEPLLRRRATVEISTDRPLVEVAVRVEAVASPTR